MKKKKMKKMKKGKVVAEAAAMLSFLPEEIMFNILSWLPVRSILRFRCVCKHWCNLFRNPDFIELHLKNTVENENLKLMLIEDSNMYSSIDYYDPSLTCCCEISEIDYPFNLTDPLDKIYIWGACNGLLCITPNPFVSDERICIWNPSTKEYKEIPMPEDDDMENTVSMTYGLGYDCDIKDYKLVRILNFCDESNRSSCEIMVYTVGLNSWKRIPVMYPYEISSFFTVLINGNLHWIGDPDIVSFEFGVERFVEVPKPENLDYIRDMNLGAVGEWLCIFGTKGHEEGFVVWVMKDYGVRESWTKLFTIVQQSLVGPYPKLVQSFKNGEFLLYIYPNNPKDDKYALVLYNPKNERDRVLKISGGDWSGAKTYDWSHVQTYVESLVSLNTGTYVVKKQVPKAIESEEAEEKQEKDDLVLWLDLRLGL